MNFKFGFVFKVGWKGKLFVSFFRRVFLEFDLDFFGGFVFLFFVLFDEFESYIESNEVIFMVINVNVCQKRKKEVSVGIIEEKLGFYVLLSKKKVVIGKKKVVKKFCFLIIDVLVLLREKIDIVLVVSVFLND